MQSNNAYIHLIDNLNNGGINALATVSRKIFLQKTAYENHSNNIEFQAMDIAKELKMNAYSVELIRYAMVLHDIGKILVSDSILNKPDKLTPEEFEVVKAHSVLGFNLIKDINKDVAAIIIQHHEKIDGSGYPYGVKDVRMESQIVSITDVFDALIKKRPYKKPFTVSESLEIIKNQAGKAWSEEVVKAFLKLY